MFLTLTYRDKNLPEHGSLKLEHFQKFMKKLRKHAWETERKKIRFFHCGEYGTLFQRPHYHALIFGYRFPDLQLWKQKKGIKLYRAPALDSGKTPLWQYGFSTVGDVTYESAGYTARYILKKVNGKSANDHYQVINKETGEVIGSRQKEYITMSRRPGIGANWLKKYETDVYPADRLIVKENFETRPPKYYDYLYEIINKKEMDKIKEKRLKQQIEKRLKTFTKNPVEQLNLEAHEKITLQRLKITGVTEREYEDGKSICSI